MFVAQCEGGYRTSEAQVRSLLELSVFRYGGGASVYAVLRGTLDDTAPDGFVVAIDTRDEMVDGTSGQLWAFNSEGDLVAIALCCGLVPAGDMLPGFFPDPDYVIAPV